MTDKKLDEILKEALVPEIKEEDIIQQIGAVQSKKTGRFASYEEHSMLTDAKATGKFFFPKKVCAACLALVIAIAAIIAAEYYGDRTDEPFAITVEAAELTKDSPAYLGETLSNTFGFTEWGEDSGKVGFIMEMPLSCQGENIEDITYSIEGGAFGILERRWDEHIILSMQPYHGDTDATGFGEGCTYVSSYTVAYDKQSGDATFINICGNHELTEEDAGYLHQNDNPKERARIYNTLLGDVRIDCTAHLKDGTEHTRSVGIGSTVMTFDEFAKKASVSDEDFINNTKEAAFLTMKLK